MPYVVTWTIPGETDPGYAEVATEEHANDLFGVMRAVGRVQICIWLNGQLMKMNARGRHSRSDHAQAHPQGKASEENRAPLRRNEIKGAAE
jgi:hypothetical protein